MIEKSEGHISFVPDTHGGFWEYWERAGDVWRQTTAAPVMPDGYRSGRWFARATPAVVANLSEIAREAADAIVREQLASLHSVSLVPARRSPFFLLETEYEGDISTCQSCGQYHDGIVHKACPSCGGYLG